MTVMRHRSNVGGALEKPQLQLQWFKTIQQDLISSNLFLNKAIDMA